MHIIFGFKFEKINAFHDKYDGLKLAVKCVKLISYVIPNKNNGDHFSFLFSISNKIKLKFLIKFFIHRFFLIFNMLLLLKHL